MARHSNRARVRSAGGIRLKSISETEAWELVASGQADRLTSNRELAQGKSLEIQLKTRRTSCRVAACLTYADTIGYSEAVDEQKTNRARVKVEKWPDTYDRRAVTIHAGSVWIPDPKDSMRRAADRLAEHKRAVGQ